MKTNPFFLPILLFPIIAQSTIAATDGTWQVLATDPEGDVSVAEDYLEVYAPTPSVDIREILVSENETAIGVSLRFQDLSDLETFNAAVFVHHSFRVETPRVAPAELSYAGDHEHRYFGVSVRLTTGFWALYEDAEEREVRTGFRLNDVFDCENESVTGSCNVSDLPTGAYDFEEDTLTAWVNKTTFLDFIPEVSPSANLSIKSEAWLAPCMPWGIYYSCSANRGQIIGLDVAPHEGIEPVRDAFSQPVAIAWNASFDFDPPNPGAQDSNETIGAPSRLPSTGALTTFVFALAVLAVIQNRRRA